MAIWTRKSFNHGNGWFISKQIMLNETAGITGGETLLNYHRKSVTSSFTIKVTQVYREGLTPFEHLPLDDRCSIMSCANTPSCKTQWISAPSIFAIGARFVSTCLLAQSTWITSNVNPSIHWYKILHLVLCFQNPPSNFWLILFSAQWNYLKTFSTVSP